MASVRTCRRVFLPKRRRYERRPRLICSTSATHSRTSLGTAGVTTVPSSTSACARTPRCENWKSLGRPSRTFLNTRNCAGPRSLETDCRHARQSHSRLLRGEPCDRVGGGPDGPTYAQRCRTRASERVLNETQGGLHVLAATFTHTPRLPSDPQNRGTARTERRRLASEARSCGVPFVDRPVLCLVGSGARRSGDTALEPRSRRFWMSAEA